MLAFTADGELAPGLRAELDALAAGPVPLATAVISAAPTRTASHDHTGRLFPLYGAQPGTVCLIRPDGHLYARRQHPGPGEIRAWAKAMTAGRGIGRDTR